MRKLVSIVLIGWIVLTSTAERAIGQSPLDSMVKMQEGAEPDHGSNSADDESLVGETATSEPDEPTSLLPGLLACLGAGALGAMLLAAHLIRGRKSD